MGDFNIEVLALARETRGYTQSELSKALEVEQGTISKIENGRLSANEDLIKKIADVLDYPLELFYDEERVIKVEGHYRKKISLPVKEQKEYIGKMTFAERQINKLSDAVELPTPNIPTWDLEVDGNIAEAAAYVRDFWRIPRGRIEDLARICEDNGIIIVPLDLGDMDALSTYSAKYNIPILYINKKRPADRIRFNIAHELAHYTCHFGKKVSSDRDIEKEAQVFASELLLPSKDILPQLTKVSIEKLSELKRYWKVSMAAILYKAKDLGAITQNQYYYIVKQMSGLGYKKKEPVDVPFDKPSLIGEIMQTYIDELGYSKAELAKILLMSEGDLGVVYFGDKPTTRFNIYKSKTG